MRDPRGRLARWFAGSLFAMSAVPAAETSAGTAAQSRPNVVLVVVDDLRWDDLGRGGPSLRADAEHRPPGARGRALPERLRHHAALLAQPGQHPDRPVRAPPRHPRQHRPQRAEPQAGHVPARAAGRRLRDGLHRQVAHGQRRHAPARLRPLGEHEGPGRGERSGAATRTASAAAVQGYVTDILTERALAVRRAAARSGRSSCMLAHKALHPNIVQRADGSVDRHRRGRVHPRRAAPETSTPTPSLPRRPNYAGAATGQARAGAPDRRPAAARSGDRDRRRDDPRPAAHAGRGGRRARPAPGGARERAARSTTRSFVLTGDHGYFYGEHGLSEERRLAYEESIRIPLLIRYPRVIRPGLTPAQMALTIDLAPTLLDLAGARARRCRWTGARWSPLLRGDGAALARLLPHRVHERHRLPAHRRHGLRGGPRTERHKYVRYRELDGHGRAVRPRRPIPTSCRTWRALHWRGLSSWSWDESSTACVASPRPRPRSVRRRGRKKFATFPLSTPSEATTWPPDTRISRI